MFLCADKHAKMLKTKSVFNYTNVWKRIAFAVTLQ